MWVSSASDPDREIANAAALTHLCAEAGRVRWIASIRRRPRGFDSHPVAVAAVIELRKQRPAGDAVSG